MNNYINDYYLSHSTPVLRVLTSYHTIWYNVYMFRGDILWD